MTQRSGAEALTAFAVMLLLGLGLWAVADGGDANGEDTSPTTVPVDTEAVARGEVIATDAGCTACHTTDGIPLTGPTWKGLAGSSRPLESGESVIADFDYLVRAITDPTAEVVEGFPGAVMPDNYSSILTADEIADLVAFIQSLAG